MIPVQILIISNILISKVMCSPLLLDNFDQGNQSNDYLADHCQSIHTHAPTHTKSKENVAWGWGQEFEVQFLILPCANPLTLGKTYASSEHLLNIYCSIYKLRVNIQKNHIISYRRLFLIKLSIIDVTQSSLCGKLRWPSKDNIIERYSVCRFFNILNYLMTRS